MKVSVVIPTYERPNMLARLLESIAKQTRIPDEVLLVDDGSKADYTKVVSHFQSILPNLVYVKNRKNRGAPHSRNQGILKAKGEWIALVDDDDEWRPSKLEKQLALSDEKEVGIIYTWTEAVKDGEVVLSYKAKNEGRVLADLLLECFIPSPSVLVRRSALLEAGLFDESFTSCQDWDMWTRVVACGYLCKVVESFETIYHKHDLPTIGTSLKAREGLIAYYKKHRRHYRKYHKIKYLKMLAGDLKKCLQF